MIMRLNTNRLRNGSHSRYNAELARLMIIIQNSCTTLDAAASNNEDALTYASSLSSEKVHRHIIYVVRSITYLPYISL